MARFRELDEKIWNDDENRYICCLPETGEADPGVLGASGGHQNDDPHRHGTSTSFIFQHIFLTFMCVCVCVCVCVRVCMCALAEVYDIIEYYISLTIRTDNIYIYI